MTTLSNTAILIFANSAKEELYRKPLLHSEELFDALTAKTIKIAGETDLPVFHFSDKDQVGATFGQRFTNAIANVFDKGFSSIITIGNDTPHLKTRHLHLAKEALENRKTVLGPSLDGGFYLLGIHKSSFNQKEFRQLPWQRFNLLNKISLLLDRIECVVFNLPVLQDIDTIQDVRRLNNFTSSISAKVRTLLHKILEKGKSVIIKIDAFISSTIFFVPFNKGSPF